MARRQIDPRHVAQLGQAGEEGIALLDGLVVLLGGEPGRDDGARHVEAGVVGELGCPVDDTTRLGHGALLERRQLLLGEPGEVLPLGEGLRRRHREVLLGRLRIGLALAGAGVDIDHGRDLLRDAVGDGIARCAGAAVHGEHDRPTRSRDRVADRVDMVGEGDRRSVGVHRLEARQCQRRDLVSVGSEGGGALVGKAARCQTPGELETRARDN